MGLHHSEWLAHPLGHRRRLQDASKIEVGIWGEHRSGASNAKFCRQVAIDYVSASPFRIPIARPAAAQVVAEAAPKAKRKKK